SLLYVEWMDLSSAHRTSKKAESFIWWCHPIKRALGHIENCCFDMERENLASDAKGNDKRLPPRGRIPMQRPRGGAIRSSDEIPVMGMERRDGVAQLATVTNLLRQGGVA
ncbi:hypothetical protein, partial [Acidithiobacillus concretivorus]|uniref:hypothetical protein n=1 Tax=Acidithiobacillus concretivorus TaxID=3063952 RepID=UPI001C069FD7